MAVMGFPFSSSMSDATLFVHWLLFLRVCEESIFATFELCLNMNCIIMSGLSFSGTIAFFEARCVIVVNGWISRIEDLE